MSSTPARPPRRPPLQLPIEQSVRCPRGGTVPIEHCYACSLLQGTLSGEYPRILCAYPEAQPALRPARRTVPVGPGRAVSRSPQRRRPDLIFTSDWPDD